MRESPGEHKGIVVTDIRRYTNAPANAADLFTILAKKESTYFTFLLLSPPFPSVAIPPILSDFEKKSFLECN